MTKLAWSEPWVKRSIRIYRGPCDKNLDRSIIAKEIILNLLNK